MRIVFLGLMGALLLAGCSRNEKLPEVAAPAEETKPTAPDPMIAASLEDVSKKIAAQNYDAAVGSLVAVGSLPKNDAQQAAYQKQLREVNDALSKKVAQGDQKAWESQQMLGRMMTGR